MRSQSRDIVWATVLNTVVPFLLGTLLMLAMGYGWLVAVVIGITRMPTAEAVIVPILDEFQMLRTRVGQFIVGVGVLDDVIEVFLVALVSVWMTEQTVGAVSIEREIGTLIASLLVFIVVSFAAYRWILPLIGDWLPRRARNLMLLAMCVLFGFGGFSAYSSLGIVVGAIVAGILMRPLFERNGQAGKQAGQAVEAVSYGFFGIIFFFWVGLSVDVEGMLDAPLLAILLFLAAFIGKLLGIFIMVLMGKLNSREAWTIGIGLNARLTTEIIVAKLLLDAGLIDNNLFTALIAASSLSTLIVPLLFTLLVRRWGMHLGQGTVDG
jgi:Ca2+-transporting ATPase